MYEFLHLHTVFIQFIVYLLHFTLYKLLKNFNNNIFKMIIYTVYTIPSIPLSKININYFNLLFNHYYMFLCVHYFLLNFISNKKFLFSIKKKKMNF